jgi:hypothetical protein
MAKIVQVIMPIAPVIMSITLEVDREEIDKLPADDGLLIMLTIVQQNIKYLKNLLGPVVSLIKGIVEAVTDTLG